MTNSNKLKIIYATQSGSAQEVAERLSREIYNQIGLANSVVDIENYDFKSLLPNEKSVVFVVSTQGHGDVPDTMKTFWSFLLIRSLPSNALAGLKFAVLGLGDSSYTTFNFASKKLNQRLLSLGAHQLVRRGDADDQHDLGIDYEVEKWTKEIIDQLTTIYPIDPSFTPIDRLKLQPSKYIIKYNDDGGDITTTNNNQQQQQQQYKSTILIKNKRITNNEWTQDVRHLEIDIHNTDLKYNSGDVAYILPKNSASLVDELINYLELDQDLLIYDIQPRNSDTTQKPLNIRYPVSVRELLTCYFDISGSPKRYFFELLQFFVTEESHKERLQYFSSSEGQDDLRIYNQKELRNYIDVIKEFKCGAIPLDYLFDLISPIKARPFSISSSPLVHPNCVHVTVGLVKYTTPLRKLTRMGLCSRWFQTMECGTEILMYIKASGAKPPSSLATPLIMVGPGTGCAIFRSFIQERDFKLSQLQAEQQQAKRQSKIGDSLFYFGNRYSEMDYLYQEEFEHYRDVGHLTKLSVCFSREQQDRKHYVQDLMKLDSQLIWRLLEDGACFYISGSSGRMPKDVRQQLLTIIKEGMVSSGFYTSNESGGDTKDLDQLANDYLVKLEKDKRYTTETW
ncbi:NADPH-dependent diflavin oxidoreductase 1 [Heterostelium album PN500]|uniref:NADPH-dependent diflavin oxidoreductase 1 n=1 Tax=Heterostelium pallidum (strain ATCC 26659 / Pp 5 / PN500) TaxID=670386 RepID=D3BL25_HETP5|nr:NADPH-dependent diflavin oxidoreductase 1 [Heterostelium album PN500]EFA77759.1 NADPH-dependent diflavin oxidoreductase 1 [Heterostelium album PN500]|eukprot:XP_020429887.1 NADPH-dependent diflavin oxidoreductase 1 [Heterostelium album PN500]